MKELVGVELTLDQFLLLSEHCLPDPTFPTSWESWQALIDKVNRQAKADGVELPPLRLDPNAFRRWCTGVAIIPCMDALRAYASIHRTPPDSTRYGGVPLDSRPGALDP